jgi:hypothetical protein
VKDASGFLPIDAAGGEPKAHAAYGKAQDDEKGAAHRVDTLLRLL